MSSYTNPTVEDFKTYFVRDFNYGTDIDINVLDADITRAIDQSDLRINEALFVSQEEFTIGFLLLIAHFLCLNIHASSQGLNGKNEWLINSRSVGSVSVSETIPEGIINDPIFSWYCKTTYGAQHLMMVYPRLHGNVFMVDGATTP